MRRDRNKIFTLIVLLVMLILLPLGARSTFDIGLQSAMLYGCSESGSDGDFFQEMSVGRNWAIGVGLDMRMTVFHLSLLASSDSETEEAFNIYSSLSFDLPVINDFIYLTAGAGVTTGIEFLSDEGSRLGYNGVASNGDESFSEVLGNSPIHLKAGLDFILGHAAFSLYYMRQSDQVLDNGIEGIWSAGGSNMVGLALNLSVM